MNRYQVHRPFICFHTGNNCIGIYYVIGIYGTAILVGHSWNSIIYEDCLPVQLMKNNWYNTILSITNIQKLPVHLMLDDGSRLSLHDSSLRKLHDNAMSILLNNHGNQLFGIKD